MPRSACSNRRRDLVGRAGQTEPAASSPAGLLAKPARRAAGAFESPRILQRARRVTQQLRPQPPPLKLFPPPPWFCGGGGLLTGPGWPEVWLALVMVIACIDRSCR